MKNVEYLVQFSQLVSDSEKKAIYKILMTYPFPMNMNPLNQDEIKKLDENLNKSLEQGKKLSDLSEKERLQKLIDQVAKGVKLLVIPKTLYQLFCFVYAYKKPFLLPHFDPNHFLIDEKETTYSDDTTMYKYILDCIDKDVIQTFWWEINSLVIGAWDGNLKSLDEFVEKMMNDYAGLISENNGDLKKILSQYKRDKSNGRSFGYYFPNLPHLPRIKAHLKTVATEEYRDSENYLLYCAVEGSIKSTKVLNISAGLSWSFGDGLTAGGLFDFGACSMHFLAESSSRTLWVLKIDPIQFQILNSSVRQLVHVPPIPNLLKLCGKGEFFHPRTKVSSKVTNHSFGSGAAMAGTVSCKIGKSAVFIANDLDEAVYCKALQELCENRYSRMPESKTAKENVVVQSTVSAQAAGAQAAGAGAQAAGGKNISHSESNPITYLLQSRVNQNTDNGGTATQTPKNAMGSVSLVLP